MRIFRSLLMTTISVVKKYLAFATFTGAQEGDTIKLNDGMATSNKDYSAYPNDTTITGDFTLTTIAGQVNDTNHTIEIEEPVTTEYDGTIQAGKLFYAYTPEGGTQKNSYYTKDDPIIDNSLIVDIVNNGCTDLGNGVFQGVVGKTMQTTFVPEISTANTWEIATKYTFGTGRSQATVLGYGYSSGTSYRDYSAPYIGTENTSNFRVFLSTNGSSWNLLQNKDTGVAKTGTTWIKLKFTGTQYIFSWKKNETDNYTDVVLLESTTKTYCTSTLGFLNLPFNTTNYCSEGGTIDLLQTSITINGNTRYLAYRHIPSTLYDNTFNELNPQPTFTIKRRGLNNITNNGCTDLGNGIFQGGNNKYMQADYVWQLQTANSWKFKTVCTYNGGGSSPCIVGCSQSDYRTPIFGHVNNNQMLTLLSSTGYSWDMYSSVVTDIDSGEVLTLNTNTTYYLEWGFTGTEYYLWYSTIGWSDTGKTLTYLRTTTTIKCTDPVLFLGNRNLYQYCWAGTIDLSQTSMTIDNVETRFYNEDDHIIITSETPNIVATRTPDNDLLQDIESNISIIDNTTIHNVVVSTDINNAIIKTSANITKINNDNVITDGSYHIFNLTVPTDKTAYIQSGGIEYQINDIPLLVKSDRGVNLLLKDGNNSYYLNHWVLTRDYDLHYQQINFSYPTGATVTCKVNNVLQSNLTPYAYSGDIISWTCNNAGTITTGNYTVAYSKLDNNIQTITIS